MPLILFLYQLFNLSLMRHRSTRGTPATSGCAFVGDRISIAQRGHYDAVIGYIKMPLAPMAPQNTSKEE
jgi:hypothetical protein